ncbi:unnamed protein product, partial [Urochloa humidicola]
CWSAGAHTSSASVRGATNPAQHHHPHPPRAHRILRNPTRSASTERGEEEKKPKKRGESMELCVSITASARAAAAPFRCGACPVTAVPLRRRLPARGWRYATAAVPDPVPSEEPASASSTVVVTDKPESPADEKVEEVSAASSGSVEAPVAELVSSEASPSPSPDDGGLDEILSKLNIEVTPTLILTGSGAFIALWVLSSIVSAIDSVPLIPKFLELVGTGYSIWFIARYLIFKESRDDFFAKLEDLKQRII